MIAAVHAGMRVLGFSAITNMATGGADQQPDTIEEVHRVAGLAGKKLRTALEILLPRMRPKDASAARGGDST